MFVCSPCGISHNKRALLCFADPTHVIGLYPDLLPSDYRRQLQYPNPLPALSGAELERAHLALIDYLTQVCACLTEPCGCDFKWCNANTLFFFFSAMSCQKRSRLVKHLNDSNPSTTSPLVEGIPTIKSHRKLLQIIDTTLLQCYLHVSPRNSEGHYIPNSQNIQHNR